MSFITAIGPKSDRKYRARWRTPDGASRSKTLARKVDAERHLANMTVSVAQGAYVDPGAGRETVAAYASRWAAAQPWRASSRDRVAHVLGAQIVPRFGRMPRRAVRASEVQAWVGEMSTSGLAPSTVESYFRVLAAVMLAARRDRLIHDSPCERVRLPRADRAKSALVPLTSDQAHAIAEAVPGRYRALVYTSAGLGLRQGEACGLTVDRVDFLRRRVTIDRQLVTPAGAGPAKFGPTKTPSSNRAVALPDAVATALAGHLSEYAPGRDGLIFTSRTGAALRRSTWSDVFRSATRSLGVDASTHDLPHHCASMLIAAGCSVTAVQHFLGHKNASETLDTYSHLWPNDEDRIRSAIDAGLASASRTRHVAVAGAY